MLNLHKLLETCLLWLNNYSNFNEMEWIVGFKLSLYYEFLLESLILYLFF